MSQLKLLKLKDLPVPLHFRFILGPHHQHGPILKASPHPSSKEFPGFHPSSLVCTNLIFVSLFIPNATLSIFVLVSHHNFGKDSAHDTVMGYLDVSRKGINLELWC